MRNAPRSQEDSLLSSAGRPDAGSPVQSGQGEAGWTRLDPRSVDEAVDPIELQEFLETDWSHIQANPAFKERLRGELWRLLQSMKNGNESDCSSS
jgi:hypothetical protein